MDYKYSIIIPHKDSPELLQRCINSIPLREDIEIIIIDDNSNKNIVDFNKFPGKELPNSKVIFSKEGKGAGFARNLGLKNASGKWIMFADSDDFYEPNAFNIIDKNIEECIDIIYFAANSRNSDNLKINERRVIPNESVLNFKKNDSLSDLKIRYRNPVPWNKVIKRELIFENRISFDEIKTGNDAFFSLKISHAANKYKVIKKNLYSYTFRINSISIQKRNIKDENLLLISRIRTNQFYKSIDKMQLCRPYLGILYTIYRRNGLVYFIKYIVYVLMHLQYLNKIKNNWNKPELIN